MYDQVLSLLLIKTQKIRRHDPKAEQAFYDRAEWNVPAGLVSLWSKLVRPR